MFQRPVRDRGEVQTMRSWLRLTLAVAIALAAGEFAVGCGGGSSSSDTGTLTVGSDIPYPPFEEGQPPDYAGFDIDLVNAISDEIGRDVEYQDTEFDTIFRDLAQGKFDMVASATTITPEREQTVDFSDPYYLSEQAIVVTSDSDVKSVDDLDGLTVSVQQGTTGQAYVKDQTDASEVRPFPTGPDAVNAAKAGTADAAVLDLPVAQDAVAKESGLEIATSIPTDEEYGFVFQQDDDDLREEVNDALQKLKDDGTYAQIYKKWFKEEPPEEVLTATNEPK